MARSRLVASVILFFAGTSAFAQSGFHASSACGCAGSLAYPPANNADYPPQISAGRCHTGGCGSHFGRGDELNGAYTSPPKFPSGRQRTRRSPVIPRGMEGIAKLATADQYNALEQRFCPVTKQPLGSMGTPILVNVDGRPVFVCCEGCINTLKNDPQRYLGQLAANLPSLDQRRGKLSDLPLMSEPVQPRLPIPREMEGVALLPVSEQAAALRQRICPVTGQPLGSMGKPIRVSVAGRSIYVCCEGCVSTLKNNPRAYLSTFFPANHVR